MNYLPQRFWLSLPASLRAFRRSTLFSLIAVMFAVFLAGCGSSSNGASGTETNPGSGSTVTSDYSLTATPAAVQLTGGSSATFSVLATASGTFTSTVAVGFTGLPAGVTASPASLTLTPGTAQTVTLQASSTAAASTTVLILTGTSGTLVHTASTTLTVTALAPPAPAADFSLSLATTAVSITAGNSTGATVAVTAKAINGFTGSVAVALTGLPAGVTATPASLTLTPGQPQNIQLAAATTAAVASGTVVFTGTSGTLSHSASLAVTVVAPPVLNFSLAVAPAAQSITIENANGAQVAVSAAPVNGFASPVAVTLSGLPAGVTANPASLSLTPGTPQNVTFTASAAATAGAATITFTGTSGTLAHTALLMLTIAGAPIADVTTYHYDNTRQGLNASETILTTANVSAATFGKVGFYATDGKVDAQPLFAAGVPVSATTTENLVYVASEHDTVYAFAPTTGQQVWATSILGAGETTSDDHACSQITPEIGITATPVIDRTQGAHGAIYVVGMSKDAGGAYHHRLHALDLATGAELSGSPTEITATFPSTGATAVNGLVTFAPGDYAERAGMLLLNSTIYLAWTSHCDQTPYQGWVMGYSEATLQQTTVLNLTPNGGQGAIWMAGDGLAADTTGNIYFLDGNGSFSGTVNATGFPTDADYGNAMLKLSTTNGALAVADFFQPTNTIAESMNDTDLGSGGSILLPDLADTAGTIHHLIVGAGKDHNIYVGDRDNLGRYNSTSNANLYQQVSSALVNGSFGTPAYFNNTIYYGGVSDTLKAFPITNAMLATAPSSVSANVFNYPGTTPSISANGTTNGIVWTLAGNSNAAAVLYAYDATNLSHELYDSTQAANARDAFGTGNKFITPMIINGNVYVGTPTGVAVFGLLPATN